MIINDAGTYTLKYTATDDCGKTSTVDRELVVEEPVYGIISRSATSSVCERIGGSADFEDPVPQHSDGNGGWVGGSSPFDNIMPWSGMQIVEDEDAGTLVSIPKFWYKWTRNGDEMQLEISPSAKNGFFVSPAHADRGDGVGERDVVYVGRYHCASDFKSKTGVQPKASDARSVYRTGIHNLGANIWQYDFAMYWTICMLYLVEFADWNSQKMIGGGCTSVAYNKDNMGLTDGMTYHTGTTNVQVSETAYGQVQYRHIEGLWSNVRDWCDGIYFNNTDIYCIKNPSDFSDTTGGTNVGTKLNGDNFATNFTDPSSIVSYEYALLPSALAQEDSSRTHDYYQCSSNANVTICVGGAVDQESMNGLFAVFGYAINAGGGWTGSRLMKLPSA